LNATLEAKDHAVNALGQALYTSERLEHELTATRQNLADTHNQWEQSQQELLQMRAETEAQSKQIDQLQQALAHTRQDLQLTKQEVTQSIERSELLSRQLRDSEQCLSDAQQELRRAPQEVPEAEVRRMREAAFQSELAHAIESLQQMREELDQRDAAFAAARQRYVADHAKERAARAKVVARLEKVARKLRKRTKQLERLQARRLVRVAVKLGKWLKRPGLVEPTSSLD
jgi:chromosome segregation ATPase